MNLCNNKMNSTRDQIRQLMTAVERNNTNNPHIFRLARTQSTQLNRENQILHFNFGPSHWIPSDSLYVFNRGTEFILWSNILWCTTSRLHAKAYDECLKLVDPHADAPSLRIGDTWSFKLCEIASDTRVILWRKMMWRFPSRNADSQRSST